MIDIVIATTTFYKETDSVRAGCAIRMVANATRHGIPIVVVDGGSYPSFLEQIADLGAIVIPEVEHPRGIMGPGRRQAIAAGFEQTGGRFSCFIQPEKDCMPQFVKSLFRPIIDNEADLCSPYRYSVRSYPSAQWRAEQIGNIHFRQVTGLDYDMWFGPRFFNATAGKYFLEYDDKYGGAWDPTHIPVLRCIAAGLRIVNPVVQYVHPPEQTQEEENSSLFSEKRAAQLGNLMQATREEAKILGIARQ